jgi:hypothetical protein
VPTQNVCSLLYAIYLSGWGWFQCVCVCVYMCVYVCACKCVKIVVCQNVQHGKNALVYEIMILEEKTPY